MIYFKSSFFDFFEELAVNNSKVWFDANRTRYEKDIKVVFDQFVKDLNQAIQEFDKEISLDYKKGIFRINRDIRFSKNKDPYKLNRSASFSKDPKNDMDNPGYYIDINPINCYIAGGAWMPNPKHLKKIRQEIYYNYDEFQSIIEEPLFKKYFKTIQGARNVRLNPPESDYAKEIDFIFMKQFYFLLEFNPRRCLQDSFLDFCVERMQAAFPLNQFLRRSIEEIE
jgi:uncharacterized protein (TIGR02453 family)